MKIFSTYQEVPGMAPCIKRPVVVHAVEIDEPFRVNSIEGDFAQGKPGDFLMRGIKGELYICDREIFLASYDFTDERTC